MDDSNRDLPAGSQTQCSGKLLSPKIRSRLWIISPVILTVIALLQPFLIHRFNMNPWKGGAFGMFSTVDHFTTRILRVSVPTELGDFPALLTNSRAERMRIVCMPNLKLLIEKADLLDKKKWVLFQSGESDFPPILPGRNFEEQSAILRTYSMDEEASKNTLKSPPNFLIPARQVIGNPTTVSGNGNSRIDAYRLVYKGNGRLASEFLTSSESQ